MTTKKKTASTKKKSKKKLTVDDLNKIKGGMRMSSDKSKQASSEDGFMKDSGAEIESI